MSHETKETPNLRMEMRSTSEKIKAELHVSAIAHRVYWARAKKDAKGRGIMASGKRDMTENFLGCVLLFFDTPEHCVVHDAANNEWHVAITQTMKEGVLIEEHPAALRGLGTCGNPTRMDCTEDDCKPGKCSYYPRDESGHVITAKLKNIVRAGHMWPMRLPDEKLWMSANCDAPEPENGDENE